MLLPKYTHAISSQRMIEIVQTQSRIDSLITFFHYCQKHLAAKMHGKSIQGAVLGQQSSNITKMGT